MSKKHTPGPWSTVTGNSARQFHEISIRPINSPFPEGGNLPFPIASVRYPQYDFGLANACLISAAPDLLYALKRLVRQHGSDGIEYGGDHPMAKARAAIAKAEGAA